MRTVLLDIYLRKNVLKLTLFLNRGIVENLLTTIYETHRSVKHQNAKIP